MNTRQQPFSGAAASGVQAALRIAAKYPAIRQCSLALAAPLSEEDCCAQSMPDASPVKWHLAHTTWFFETFVLENYEENFRPFQAEFKVLFNSYYNGVGEKHPRAQRGMLTRPALSTVRDYRSNVDQRMLAAIALHGGSQAFRDLVNLGLNHEQQHQELLLTDLKHLLSLNPTAPSYREMPPVAKASAMPDGWANFSSGLIEIGAKAPIGTESEAGDYFCFDNELPRHRQYLAPYRLATRLVTNAEYLRFIEAGGYRDPQLWLSEGWDWVRTGGIEHPIYWSRDGGKWREFTLAGAIALHPDLPVSHVSYFEADAYARHAGARLPTEGEWEHASGQCLKNGKIPEGNFSDRGRYHPMAAVESGLTQMFGDLWEWTSSGYSPYPGYQPPEGAIGEYNGKFMINQYVLRGGSCATPRDHLRASYRNFFPTATRWQFTGVRLARDA